MERGDSMKNLNIPVGISDFGEIRMGGYYYVDKSGLIGELLKTDGTKATLITRPRRFGKTVGMSMLSCFFDIRRDSQGLFEGLEISKDEELCKKWMNQFPTLFFSFKDVDGLNFESAREMFRNRIADLCKQHIYLGDSGRVNEMDRKVFWQLADTVDGSPSDAELKTSLSLLMKMMQDHYGRQVILLLDEYDVPLAKADAKGYYRQMLDLVRPFMSTAVKDNSSLRFAVITGCLKIGKESIFTGMNNFTTDTISDSRYNEFFGFTQEEVAAFLEDAGCSGQMETVRTWYDGYHFGNVDVYCPWDVLNYVKKMVTEGNARPENFWEHTSDNAVIRTFLERTEFDVSEKFETLLAGGSVQEAVNENLTYDSVADSEGNFWSLLYLSGYLTKVRSEDTGQKERTDGVTALKIPNAEVMEIFRKSVVEWFYRKAAGSNRQELFRAVWDGEDGKLTMLLSDFLFDTISFHDYAESYYHAFLTGLFAGSGYIVESNYESGLGRPDLVIKDRARRQAAVIEVKVADSEAGLETGCDTALGQIAEKQYAKGLERSGFKKVLCFGIAFFRKECLVKTI